MFIIIGLGNPGKQYEGTRHNVGFEAIDQIAANFGSPAFSFEKIFNSEMSKGKFKKQKIVLVKPATFMNLSGTAAKKIIKSLKFKTEKLIVLHDDLDIPLGKIRIAQNRSSAHHKGVESTIKELKTKNFIRIRIGIKPEKEIKASENFVLKKFNKEEQKTAREAVKKSAEALEAILKEGLQKAMNEYNK